MELTIYIVTTSYNAAKTIDKTIWGVVSQEGGLRIHYHIQDAGSTDGTVDKIRDWQNRLAKMGDYLPSRVQLTWASENDSGMYEGIRKGFEAMAIPENAIMGWCNADDTLWQGGLLHVAAAATRYANQDWFTGWSSGFEDDGKFGWTEKTPVFPRQILASGLADGKSWPCLQQESTFWRKRLYDLVGGVDIKFHLAGDWDLWRRMACESELIHLQRQVGAFYRRPGQKSSATADYAREIKDKIPLDARWAKMYELLSEENNLSILTEPVMQGNGPLELCQLGMPNIPLGMWKLLPRFIYRRVLKKSARALQKKRKKGVLRFGRISS